MIMLGRFCGERPFLFAERSMPVPYIGDPDIKISDPHPGPTQRVLLDCRQLPHYDSLPAGAPGKKYRTRTQARPHVFYSTSVYLHPTTVWVWALPRKMTLGDSVNNRQGSFPFSFGI